MNNLIILNKISKSFLTSKKITVLKKINYKFKKGKVYSLVGPSGSGKSTLLNILSLIDRPSIGSVKIDNNNINFSNPSMIDKIRAKKIGVNDLNKKYNIDDMVNGDVIFCATGVTDGDIVKGIKYQGDSFNAETLILHKSSGTNKVLKNKIKK